MKAAKKVKDNTDFPMKEVMRMLSTDKKDFQNANKSWGQLANEIIDFRKQQIEENTLRDFSKMTKAQLFKELNEHIKIAKQRITALKSKNQKHKDQIARALTVDFGDAQDVAEAIEERFK